MMHPDVLREVFSTVLTDATDLQFTARGIRQ